MKAAIALGMFLGFLFGTVFGMWLEKWFITTYPGDFGFIKI